MIISLQGSMAVGKTTLVNYLAQALPEIYVSHEDVSPVVSKINQLQLDKDSYEDYQIIQQLWIAHEIARYERVADKKLVLMDFGAEEIDFYTRFYPKACGKDWQLSLHLQETLERLQDCLPDLVIFLEASDEILKARKASDLSRKRSFFDFQLKHLLPLKRKWFLSKSNTVVVDTSNKSIQQVGDEITKIISSHISNL